MPIFDTPTPISVELSLSVGTVRIIASDRTDTVVDVRPSDPSSAADAKAAQQTQVDFAGGRLLVKALKTWRRLTPFGGAESVDVTIELPAGSRVQGSGEIVDLRGEGRFGEVGFSAGVGHIHLDETGPLRLRTGTGDILVGSSVGPVEITGCGELRLRHVDGDAVLKNLNGHTWVDDAIGELRCNAANGDITVGTAHAGVTARSASGHIRIREVVRGAVSMSTADGRLEVGIREGSAALLDVRSQYGTVHNSLTPSNGPGSAKDVVEVRARTANGDIIVRRP